MNNQDEYQVENQDEKNTSCNIFLEQLELLNQLPVNERGNVIYLALLKAFSRTSNQVENQDANQLENQLENTYISISKSISLSKLSISVLNLLNKTLGCKIYSKNWGGKRTGSGKKTVKPIEKPIIKPTKEEIEEYCQSLGKRFDDIDDFIAYYDASDWNDRAGLPINWKHAVISWISRAKRYQAEAKPKKVNMGGLF
jgi:ribosome-interacting GTPase 1